MTDPDGRSKKPTTEELADEARRSSPIGYFNFAETYRTAARTLRRSKAKASHKESPIRFLYYHGIELYLKAFLRAHDIHPRELRGKKYGHDVGKLSRQSAKLGLTLGDEDVEIMRLMSETDAVIRSRYISTGFFRWPDIGALDRTCKSLRQSIAKELRLKGINVRLS